MSNGCGLMTSTLPLSFYRTIQAFNFFSKGYSVKIVKTEEFLAMPLGTVFVKLRDGIPSEIAIKGIKYSASSRSQPETHKDSLDEKEDHYSLTGLTIKVAIAGVEIDQANDPSFSRTSTAGVKFSTTSQDHASYPADSFGIFDETEKSEIIQRLSDTLSLLKAPVQEPISLESSSSTEQSTPKVYLPSLAQEDVPFCLQKSSFGWIVSGEKFFSNRVFVRDLDSRELAEFSAFLPLFKGLSKEDRQEIATLINQMVTKRKDTSPLLSIPLPQCPGYILAYIRTNDNDVLLFSFIKKLSGWFVSSMELGNKVMHISDLAYSDLVNISQRKYSIWQGMPNLRSELASTVQDLISAKYRPGFSGNRPIPA